MPAIINTNIASLNAQRNTAMSQAALRLAGGRTALKFAGAGSDIPPNAPESLRTWSGWPAEGPGSHNAPEPQG